MKGQVMNNKKAAKHALLSLVLFGLGAAQALAEEKIDVVTNISVGVQDYEISWEDASSATKGTAEIRTAVIGVTVLDGQWHYGLSTEISGQSQADLEFCGPCDGTQNRSKATLSRSTYSLLAGRRVGDNLSIYGGYTSGDMGLDSITYGETGPFLGARYTLNTGSSSSLTVDAAYAAPKVKLSDGARFATSGDGPAYNVSLTWLRSLDRGRSFYLRLKHSLADFDVSGTDTGGTTRVAYKGEQKTTAFYLGMGF